MDEVDARTIAKSAPYPETIDRLLGHVAKSVRTEHYSAATLAPMREAVAKLRLDLDAPSPPRLPGPGAPSSFAPVGDHGAAGNASQSTGALADEVQDRDVVELVEEEFRTLFRTPRHLARPKTDRETGAEPIDNPLLAKAIRIDEAAPRKRSHGWCRPRSSKSVRGSSAVLGRFDSCALPPGFSRRPLVGAVSSSSDSPSGSPFGVSMVCRHELEKRWHEGDDGAPKLLRTARVVAGGAAGDGRARCCDPSWRSANIRVIYPAKHVGDLGGLLRPGRSVKKGKKGIQILAAAGIGRREVERGDGTTDERTWMRFRIA